jgi:endonuclease-3
VLSAQTTDASVNQATPALFARYPTPAALAEAPVEDLRRLLRPIRFSESKAPRLRELARLLVERFDGEVPRTMADLTSLPGVGNKTAAVVQGYLWGEAESVAVDTHVKRVARRLGLTSTDDARRAERELGALYPKSEWPDINFYFIKHGRTICRAPRPLCEECLVNDICPKVGVVAPRSRLRRDG